MTETHLLHDLLLRAAARAPESLALTHGDQHLSYGGLRGQVQRVAAGLLRLGVARGERVGVFLEKRVETVASCFGASLAGAVFVPVNPILRPMQVGHILQDCGVRVLVTSPQRLPALLETLSGCPELKHIVLTDAGVPPAGSGAWPPGVSRVSLAEWLEGADAGAGVGANHRVIDSDPVAILYTSGSTGKPKGVVVSHRNVLVGGKSVAQYLENTAEDVLLAALPLSFDAGFSQLTTAFHVGARVVLLNHVLPQDVVKAMAKEGVTGLTAVPPLWIQLAQLKWPEAVAERLRYFANTGGRMSLDTLTRLRQHFPHSKPYLMYGLTEAFRATYLPPEQVDARPDSIGKAIPNSEVLVLRPDGTPCDADEPGELVQRGPLVALGYWNNPERTNERFKPLPAAAGVRHAALMVPEMAVFSGDMVRRDAEGYLYFIGRNDEMIKTSGYRVSPAEVEEVLYSTGLIGECAAFGLPDEALGHAIVVVVAPPAGQASLDVEQLLKACKNLMPVYMVPRRIEVQAGGLPRNPNGKIDRTALAAQLSA
ncbi:MAG: acyl-CoA ligase (AMP-forming), exosortase A system-associated [Burkholderiales bacterium]|nr:acyl-CoA ligase (AMP-forming), exosortase A system-associated [Burkholderiales bacterium]MBH2015234.1 acyl-CoA ligase (AMP-forming), exosortase A system-associated [Burkholderiales bacterium]